VPVHRVCAGEASRCARGAEGIIGSVPEGSGHVGAGDVDVAHGPAGTFAGGAQILSVSCPSAGNCGAGGEYWDSSGHSQGLVVSEVNGVWGTALEGPWVGDP
jgi:hypothetical protein